MAESVHHPGAHPAHDSEPPGRSTFMNVDKSGVSMSWKTAVSILTVVVLGMLAWNTFSASVVRSADLKSHNEDPDAHESRITRGEVESLLNPLTKQVGDNTAAVITVQNGFYAARAEDLAYRAVEHMPKHTPDRQRIQRFEEVRRKAEANLKAKKDIREGIDVPTF